MLKPQPQRRLLNGNVSANDLTDDDPAHISQQKGIDKRIGLRIASITLKCQAEFIVLCRVGHFIWQRMTQSNSKQFAQYTNFSRIVSALYTSEVPIQVPFSAPGASSRSRC